MPGFGEIESFGPIVGTMRIEKSEFITSLASPNKIRFSNDACSNHTSGISIAISKKFSGKNVNYNKDTKQSTISVPSSPTLGYEGQPRISISKLINLK